MGLRFEEVPKCIICGNSGLQIYEGIEDCRFGVQGKFNFLQCPSCGLLWLDPRPVIDDMPKMYENCFSPQGTKPIQGNYLSSIPELFKDFLRKNVFCGYYGYRHLHRRHIFCKWANLAAKTPILKSKVIYGLGWRFPHFKNGTDTLIVDIGCGGGEYLKIMQQLGWKVLGIEPHPLAAKTARDKGIPVFEGKFEDVTLPDSAADLIIMNHMIEHLYDPLTTINKCFKILSPGAKLVIRTPNADSLGHKVFNRHLVHLDPPRHFFLFSPKNIRLLFKKSPFKKIYIRTSPLNAEYVYNRSTLIFRKGKINEKEITPQRGRSMFTFKEAVLCMLGKDCGEEIELMAVK